METRKHLQVFGEFWRTFIVVATPLLLLPLLIVIGTKEAKCGFVIIVMAIYWATEVIPLPITALLPVIVLPPLGVMTTDAVCVNYLKESIMMFVGSMMVAIAVENCNLHQRIALKALLSIGTSPRRLMLGFMLPTCFLSMWISNTATTAMMIPIAEAVLQELNEESDKSTPRLEMEAETKTKKEKDRSVRLMIYLSVAYAANNGGVGTLTGTGPNLVLKGMISTLFGSQTPINFASWMLFAVPTVLINLILCWLWLQILFIGVPWSNAGKNHGLGDGESIRRILEEKYANLGPLKMRQIMIIINFSVLVLLWFFREPKFMTGWGDYFIQETTSKPHGTNMTLNQDVCEQVSHVQIVDDASSALFIVFLLFLLPSQLTFWPFKTFQESRPSPALLDWKTIQSRFPWGVVLLFGGGFALADASKVSGLSAWMGSQLRVLSVLPPWLMVMVICIMTGAVTEFTSNVATANILLPVLAELATATGTNPLYLMVPATVTCSYAFMLPVATPPNAIVYEASGIKTSEMMLAGFVLNVVCIFVNVIAINTYGVYMFSLDTFPVWANQTQINNC